MAIQPSLFQYYWSELRMKVVEVGRLYDDGFLYLMDDPGVWIESNRDNVSSVRSLELNLVGYKGERIGDSIGELSQLTHLVIFRGSDLKCLPNTLSRLHNLHHLELYGCDKLEDLPPILGDLYNLTYLRLSPCRSLNLIESVAKLSNLTTLVISRLKELPPNLGGLYNLKSLTLDDCENYVIQSVTKLSNLTTLTICDDGKLEELPANLGDLKFLASLFLTDCYRLRCLPWSITKLSNLRFLHLTEEFRLETLPPHLNDSIIISVENTHIRKTWKELKTQITEIPIITEELAAQKTSTPGYLQLTGDPTLWIRHYNKYGLHSSLRVLDLDLEDWSCKGKIPDSIGELSQLTHLYISNGCLPHHLPPTFSRLTHLSLIKYTFGCDTKSSFVSLGNLSTLTSLHLNLEWDGELPKHIDLPISLTHLTLDFCYSSIPDSFMASMVGKLSNLNTLTLSGCGDLESLPLHLNLTKLILRQTTIKSLPIGLKHLEIIHSTGQCMFKSCNQMQECLENQLVNLKTLSYTCNLINTLSSMIRLHNFRELKLKDCFNLRELPQDLVDKLVKLCTLDVSGTRIQSLPNSIINLHNLRRLILPKCFKLDTLPPDFENKVMISVDDTDESYYKREGHYRDYGLINDCDYMTSDSIKETNEKYLEKFKQATITIIEQASPHRPSNHQPDATRIIEGSLLNGSADPTCNNNHSAFSSSLTQDEILPTRNKAAGTKPDVAAEYFSIAPMDFEAFNTDISNFPYRNNIPAVIMDNLVGWKDVEADGNCGFRCVAEVFHGGQENWPMARRAILNELKAHPDVYQKIYRDDYNSALQRVDWGSRQCGEDHYMEIVVDLFPIANFYQCIVMCFFVTNDGQNPQLSATVLPWNVGAHNNRPTKEFTIAHLGIYNKHYILLNLKDDFPVPPIPRRWYEIIDKTVMDWDSPYETRRQSWDHLTNHSRDSTHLDIIDGECFSNSNANTRQDENARHGKVKNITQKIEITRESIDKVLPQGIRLEDAATQLKVSRSTFKRALKNYGITWPSSRKRKLQDSNKSAPHNTVSSFGLLNSADPSTPTGHDHMVEISYGLNQWSLPYNLPSEPDVVKISDAVMKTVKEPPMSTQCHTDGHQCIQKHSNGAKECTLLNTIQPIESCSSFVVKATYDEDTVGFDFSLSSSVELLKEEVGRRFELEVGKFKMYYQDDENEWLLMTCMSDLTRALRFSKSPRSNVVRLSIKLRK